MRIFLVATITAVTILSACNDNDSISNPSNSTVSESDVVVKAFDDLYVCTAKREGVTAYVKDEKAAYICKNENWTLDELDKNSDSNRSSSSKITSSSSKKTSASKSSSSINKDKLSSSNDKRISSSSPQKMTSSSSNTTVNTFDCSVRNGIKIVSPKSGDMFHIGDTITVIYGADIEDSGYRFVFKTSEESVGIDLFDESMEPSNIDGNTCNEQKVVLRQDIVEETSTGIIRVIPYSKTNKGINSATFIVASQNKILQSTMIDERDNQEYRIVKIGNQIWMAENLTYKMKNSWCYNDSSVYCEKYGRLYTWAAATKACPSDWHLPSTDEWNSLFTTVGGKSTAGKVLKAQTDWINDGIGTDQFGFTILPAGYNSGHFINNGLDAVFWTPKETDTERAYAIYFAHEGDDAGIGDGHTKDAAFSVRCIKDSN
jgi:uncharacterized protein (TIGR02145 family)